MSDKKPAIRRVRPRDAASLILLRKHKLKPEVLMGRRSSSARFMPDVYVFPGGAVHSSDKLAQPASALNPELVKWMAVRDNAQHARVLAMAAVRETFEETNLILGAAGDIGPVRSSSWQAMKKLGLAPNLAKLRYFGRAITPAFLPTRFHARFLIVDAKFVSGELKSNGELLDLRWITLEEIDDWPIAEITTVMLKHLAQSLSPTSGRNFGKPFYRRRASGSCVRYE